MCVLVQQRSPKHLLVRLANEAGVNDDDWAKQAKGVDRLRGLTDDDDSQRAEVSIVSDDAFYTSSQLVVAPESVKHYLGALPPEPNPHRSGDPDDHQPEQYERVDARGRLDVVDEARLGRAHRLALVQR